MEAEHHTGDENARRHGVAFAEARQAFFDPFRQNGDASVPNEKRSFVLGYSLAERLLLVIYAERPGAARILSARPATREERRRYERA